MMLQVIGTTMAAVALPLWLLGEEILHRMNADRHVAPAPAEAARHADRHRHAAVRGRARAKAAAERTTAVTIGS